MTIRAVIIDNYDSFTHNLAQLLHGLAESVEVVRNDALDVEGVLALEPTHLLLSPGPGRPERDRDFGVCGGLVDIMRDRRAQIPLLGVCLGHQGIAHRFGARVERGPSVMHGKTSSITHDGRALFAGLPSPMEVMRYHSLVVARDSLPHELVPVAHSSDGVVQAFRHTTLPIFGVQFHPESIGTPTGRAMMENFLEGGPAA
ncbi:MAG: aminodeoxychorismate/anthranilate synthase component II [Myxococcota bacterium]